LSISKNVSIRSRPEGREIPALPPEPERVACVSIRSRPEGREIPETRRFAEAIGVVSIRSRPEGREIHANRQTRAATNTFQSAPDPKAGRYSQFRQRPPRLKLFQSAPDPKAGRYKGKRVTFTPEQIVSIRSRPEGREIPCTGIMRRPRNFRFNPLPTRRPGDTQGRGEALALSDVFQSAPDPKAGRYEAADAWEAKTKRVSIHSRPEGREIPAHCRC